MSGESFLNGRVVLHAGDSRDVLKTIPDCSIDSIVTDPPYALVSIVKRFGKPGSAPVKVDEFFDADGNSKGASPYKRASAGFMGKQWDTGETAFATDFWTECLRVLKPGGHCVAFSGTRTYHRMACAIEDAGFEIRDMLSWLYGSGFPKSHDVSKGIDKNNGKHLVDLSPFGAYIKQLRLEKGCSLAQLDEMMGTNTAASWWEGRKSGVQLPSKATYEKLKICLEMDSRFDSLIDWAEAEREKIGEKASGLSEGSGTTVGRFTDSRNERGLIDITAPATDAAIQWQGWGTALKPACEPICFGRKPLSEPTIAANVLRWGTGAINIDGCRVEGAPRTTHADGDHRQKLNGRNLLQFSIALYDAGWKHHNLLVWKKPCGIPNRWYFKNAEFTLYLFKGKAETIANPGSLVVFECENRMDDRMHPSQKPVDLLAHYISNSAQPDDVVIDPFMGVGTTGVAAVKLGRKFIGIEIESKYFDIACRRISDALARPDLFIEAPRPVKQEAML